ncbi:type IX secretion system membrane protein PorP/SprF [Pedobacter borealis]|uniref:type IX secretion system membrane protein PorP/SprF n=1 Tax=Pedobacter borealis TaxID=475254 RepID=UPI001428C5A2|nr:type IX secretion system membrane protein PorP/SprF [Pedobacter borealis]
MIFQYRFHFGLSAGIMAQRLIADEINGNPNDDLVGRYNQRAAHFDGDFGLALTKGRICIEASLPNLRNLLWKDEGNVVDLPTFYSAISYKIPVNDAEIEPKIAFRGIKGFDNIWDAGAQLGFAKKQLLLNGIYHSSGSTSFGIGMDYQKKYLIT